MVYEQKQARTGGGYDKTKDVEIFGAETEVGETKLGVKVYSYNGGDPKVQIQRMVKGKEGGDWIFTKLGRLNKEELKATSSLLKQAYEKM